tara:strand:- start:421 stop:987 length:567 start_codon:yes stop_codon:yes gene_type:complete
LTEVSRISVVSGPSSPPDLVVVARITTIHGVKGWVKIHPYTDEPENIFDYKPWWLQTDQGWKKIQVAQYKVASQDLIVQILDFDDRDIARQELCQKNIAVERSEFPELDSNEYYWHQLEGLRVISIQDGIDLGVVAGLMETGANDVLEVKGDIDSLDFKERLIPYTKQVVLTVNLISKKIEVDWDAEF